MKRSPLRRKTPLPSAPLTTGRRSRKARKPAETMRVYGGVKRINWIKSLPCCWCGIHGRSENAHTVTGGTGRKADASTIVPLCNDCHRAYDRHLAPFDAECCREGVRVHALVIERQWQARSGGPEHISAVVARVMEEL